MSDIPSDFLGSCSSCTQCGTVCPFLERYGSPEDIITNRPHLVFLCTNCTACDRRCPLELSPSTAIFETKKSLIEGQLVPAEAARALKEAEAFARRGHKAPFLRYDRTETAFWPGCSLAGTSPQTVEATRTLLARILNRDVGLALDCCFDPLYQMGDIRKVREACERIRHRLKSAGIEYLVTGCANCRKVFERHMGGFRVDHVLEVLPEDTLGYLPSEDIYLHHPCPHYHVSGIVDKTRDLLSGAMAGEVDEQPLPACCGLGGGLNSQAPSLAEEFTERVTMAAYGASIVTACMGCKNTFLKKGTPTYHILELVTGVKSRKKAVGSARKWANRLLLAQGRKKPVGS